jgi:hypothetical protein
MNIPPSAARDMTMWEYEATFVNWNKQHDPDGDLDPVTPEDWHGMMAFFESNPQFLQ